jgi:hypothetical protein
MDIFFLAIGIILIIVGMVLISSLLEKDYDDF